MVVNAEALIIDGMSAVDATNLATYNTRCCCINVFKKACATWTKEKTTRNEPPPPPKYNCAIWCSFLFQIVQYFVTKVSGGGVVIPMDGWGQAGENITITSLTILKGKYTWYMIYLMSSCYSLSDAIVMHGAELCHAKKWSTISREQIHYSCMHHEWPNQMGIILLCWQQLHQVGLFANIIYCSSSFTGSYPFVTAVVHWVFRSINIFHVSDKAAPAQTTSHTGLYVAIFLGVPFLLLVIFICVRIYLIR